MKSTFSVIYYLKRQVVKKDGTVPVMGRITVDGSQTQFSCKLTVDPKLWDTKGGRVTGRSTAALETNRMLDKMRVRINKHYQEIMERDNFVTAEKVKNAFLGLEHRYHTLKRFFERFEQNGLTINRFRADCGSCSEEIVEEIEKHSKSFYLYRNIR